MNCYYRGCRPFLRRGRKTDIRIETTFAAPKTHPPEADLSIVVGTGPWEGLTVHELFAQSFIAACLSRSSCSKNPIDTYADLNGKTLLLHEERARRLGAVGAGDLESRRSNPTAW